MSVSPKLPILLFVANHLHFLNHYYLHLIEYFKLKGYQIMVMVPLTKENDRLNNGQDFKIHVLKQYPDNNNDTLNTLKMVTEIRKGIIEMKPIAIFTFTFKISIATAIASRNLRIPVYPTLTGLGFLFTHQKIMALISGYFCKFIFKKCPQIIFQNNTDYFYFLNKRWIRKENIGLINGSGIDLKYFSPIPYPADHKIRIILYLGRMQGDKGINCLIKSLIRLKEGRIPFKCILAGPINGGHPTDIPLAKLKEWQKEGLIIFIGNRLDVRPLLRQANILIQPSKREGLSRTILEAHACGRPVISSTAPGCGELIREGENGWIFSTGNEKKLALVLRKVLLLPYDILFSMSQKTPQSISCNYANRSVQEHYGRILNKQNSKMCEIY